MSFEQTVSVVALVLFFAVFFGNTALVARRSINPFAFVGSSSKRRLGAEVTLLASLSVFFAEVIKEAFRLRVCWLPAFAHRELFASEAAKWAGAALIAAGFILLIVAYIELGPSWRIGMDEQQHGMLVTTGIYGWTRNPIHLFFNLYVWGTALMIPSPVFLALALMVTVAAHRVTRAEESFLRECFGTAYKDYAQRTGRYLPLRKPASRAAPAAAPAPASPVRQSLRASGFGGIAREVLARPERGRTTGQVIVWWEKRRGYYSLAVAGFCLLFTTVGVLTKYFDGAGRHALGETAAVSLFLTIVLLVTANFWYTGSWIAELALRLIIDEALLGFGPWMFGIGIVFSFLFCGFIFLVFPA